MILTEIGEIGIHKGGAVYKLRPSLYAISKLGTPVEIVETFARIFAEHFTPRGKTEQFADALAVLYACCQDDASAEAIVGTYTPRVQAHRAPWAPGVYRRGFIAPGVVLVLARSLLTHGVIGDVERTPTAPSDEPDYLTEFAARDYVAMAMAHLGCSEHDAWNMTMTGLSLALRSKYPSSKDDGTTTRDGRRVPSMGEYDAAMAFLDNLEGV